jgi:exodeoxyribonuclease VII large subunit
MPVLTITQITQAIKLCLESTFSVIWLQGELSNVKLHTSGHLYFSLKDQGAQIAAVMYRSDVQLLKAIPKDGAQIVARGELNVYALGGKYQFVVQELKLVGIGELLQKLEELKIKLHKKGYFKKEYKKSIPKIPKRIGVVTSPTGAAIQDILNVLTRRFSGFQLILNPVKVQGEGAAQEIAQAIRQFNQYDLVDVMIVGRGGGSFEDLWAFNEEMVADAIFESRIPIISAVGHEVDHCIADYVADVRAPTPSAAAEIVIAEKVHQLQHLAHLKKRLVQTLGHLLKHCRQCLKSVQQQSIWLSPYVILGSRMQQMDDIREKADRSMLQHIDKRKMLLNSIKQQLQMLKPSAQLANLRHKLMQADSALRNAWKMQMIHRRQKLNASARFKQLEFLEGTLIVRSLERLNAVGEALKSIHPKNLIGKGYAILFAEKDSSVITSIHAVEKGQRIKALVSDGEIISTVNQITSSDGTHSTTC